MLKIGAVKWRGKCSRHPKFDPFEGEGGVRGGCEKCMTLIEIHQLHRKMLSLMKTFAPPSEKKRSNAKAVEPDRQIGLFEEVG